MLEELGAVLPDDSELLSICEGDRIKADAVRDQLQALQRGERFFSVRTARRIFSNLTSIKRGARKYLRVRGETPWLVDLPCCHLLALACQCIQAGVTTAEEFLHYCEGDFYQKLADEGGFSRNEVKEAFTRRALNAPNRHRYQRSPVMRFFRRRWKHICPIHVPTEGQRQAHQGMPEAPQQARTVPATMGGEPGGLQDLRPHPQGTPRLLDRHHPRRRRVP